MEIIGFPNYHIYPNGKVINQYGKEMKHVIQGKYYAVCLRNKPNQKTIHIHRLLALHYIPNPNNYPHVDHKDRDKLNNSLDNLRWATPLLNQQNLGKYITNTSGHKNIHLRKCRGSWTYHYRVLGETIFRRSFKSKIDCLCYKYICLLKINIKLK